MKSRSTAKKNTRKTKKEVSRIRENIFFAFVFAAACGVLGYLLGNANAYITLPVRSSEETIPLKQAKLIIDHDATTGRTGFRGMVDSDGIDRLAVRGPAGTILAFKGVGPFGLLGMSELVFETVKPADSTISFDDFVKQLPAGNYTMKGLGVREWEYTELNEGVAWFTHDIPAAPELLTPREDEVVRAEALDVRWNPVTETANGERIFLSAYRLEVEKEGEVDPNVIGRTVFSIQLPPSTTNTTIPRGFLEPGSFYTWKVIAIERSGNQTSSSGTFRTE